MCFGGSKKNQHLYSKTLDKTDKNIPLHPISERLYLCEEIYACFGIANSNFRGYYLRHAGSNKLVSEHPMGVDEFGLLFHSHKSGLFPGQQCSY